MKARVSLTPRYLSLPVNLGVESFHTGSNKNLVMERLGMRIARVYVWDDLGLILVVIQCLQN